MLKISKNISRTCRALSLLEILVFTTINLIVLVVLLQLYSLAAQTYLRQIGRNKMLTTIQYIMGCLERDVSRLDTKDYYIYDAPQKKLYRINSILQRESLGGTVPVELFNLCLVAENKLTVQITLSNPNQTSECFKFIREFNYYDQS